MLEKEPKKKTNKKQERQQQSIYLFGLNDFEVEVIALCELLRRRLDDVEDVAMRAGIRFEECVFFDELLDLLQSFAVVEAFEDDFRLVDPRVHVVHARVELLLLPGLR